MRTFLFLLATIHCPQTGVARMLPNWREYSRFSGFPARLAACPWSVRQGPTAEVDGSAFST
jgi:hypothetical protein